MYALVKEGSVVKITDRLPRSFENISGFRFLSDAEAKAYGWYTFERTRPDIADPALEKYGPSVDTIDDNLGTVIRTMTIVPRTAEETEAYRANDDLRRVTEATKDIALILTELLPWMVQNTPMQVTDFTPAVRQSYLDLKTIADRIRAREA